MIIDVSAQTIGRSTLSAFGNSVANDGIFIQARPNYFLAEVRTDIIRKEPQAPFEYKISKKNKKRFTLGLIESIYNFHNQYGRVQEKFEIIESFKVKPKSRPCNYSVAKFIFE
jgi:hypothetical protein